MAEIKESLRRAVQYGLSANGGPSDPLLDPKDEEFIESLVDELAGTDDACPICAEPFKRDDLCATDIEMGTCHAACLDGSPVVNLETGEPFDGPIDTYRYGG